MNALDAGGPNELQKQNNIKIPDFAPAEDVPRKHRHGPTKQPTKNKTTLSKGTASHSHSPCQDDHVNLRLDDHFDIQLKEET
jgi:hypothetical protein